MCHQSTVWRERDKLRDSSRSFSAHFRSLHLHITEIKSRFYRMNEQEWTPEWLSSLHLIDECLSYSNAPFILMPFRRALEFRWRLREREDGMLHPFEPFLNRSEGVSNGQIIIIFLTTSKSYVQQTVGRIPPVRWRTFITFIKYLWSESSEPVIASLSSRSSICRVLFIFTSSNFWLGSTPKDNFPFYEGVTSHDVLIKRP